MWEKIGPAVWSFLRVLAVTAAALATPILANGGTLSDVWDAREAILAGVAYSALLTVRNWRNPNDPRFGRFTPADPSIGRGDPQLDSGRAFE